MKDLEERTESASLSLANEAKEKDASKGYGMLAGMMSLSLIILALFAGYSILWTKVAEHIRAQYPLVLKDLMDSPTDIAKPEITGYPGKIHVYIAEETLKNEQGSVTFNEIRLESWPLPGMTTHAVTGPVEVTNFKWPAPLNFDLLSVTFDIIDGKLIKIKDSALTMSTFKATILGTVDLRQEPFPLLDLTLKLDDHQALLQNLGVKGIIEPRVALFMNAGLSALANPDGTVEVPLHQKGKMLYAGPLPIMELPETQMQPQAIDTSVTSEVNTPSTYEDGAPETQGLPAPSP
jgi:hypothetical protein